MKKETRTEYIIQYRRRCDGDQWQGYQIRPYRNLADAQAELAQFMRRENAERKAGKSVNCCGSLAVESAHYSEYDVVAYRIRAREVTPWETIREEVTE